MGEGFEPKADEIIQKQTNLYMYFIACEYLLIGIM